MPSISETVYKCCSNTHFYNPASFKENENEACWVPQTNQNMLFF